ncbi:MAG: hypothetical protein IK150_03055 [Lachnospiraceae bacterium]|nr:hypothetical protein [Lachnospiraceae bacterium]
MSNGLRIGLSEVSITPDKSISLVGQFYERISEYVETPITATCLVIEKDGEQMTQLSTDMTGITTDLLKAVRERVADVPGMDPMKLMINATHTHTSHTYEDPKKKDNELVSSLHVLQRYLKGGVYESLTAGRKPEMDSYEAFEFLADRMAQACREAWANLHPGHIRFGFGRAAIGMCRRAVYDDGTAKMWGDTNMANFQELEGGNDSGIELAFICGEDGEKLEAVVANVCCPSQILEHHSFISSDYWGKVRILLRKEFGEELKVVGLCSPAGDICPRDLIRWVDPDEPVNDPNIKHLTHVERNADPSMFDIPGTWRAGKRIFHEIVDAWELAKEEDPCDVFIHQVLKVELPLRRVTITEYNHALEEIQKFADTHTNYNADDMAAMHVYAGTAARYENQQTQDLFPIEEHIIRLGSVALATSPFELFLDYANQIRARSLAKQTFLVQLTNGEAGYLPTLKAEKGSHYSAYVSSGTVGHEGGALYVRKTTDVINKMFGRK